MGQGHLSLTETSETAGKAPYGKSFELSFKEWMGVGWADEWGEGTRWL